MVQRVTLENGEVHTFPDDTTPQEMQEALASIAPQQSAQPQNQTIPTMFGQLPDPRTNNFMQQATSDMHNLLRNIGAGAGAATKSLASIIPMLSKLAPQSMQRFLPQQSDINFDPYKMMGVQDQPFTTQAGLEQTAGSFLIPAHFISEAFKLGAPIVKGAVKALAKPFSTEGLKEPEIQHATTILDKLGHGVKTVDESNRELAKDIKSAFKPHKEAYQEIINPVMEDVGGKNIYKEDPLARDYMGSYLGDSKEAMDKIGEFNIGAVYDKFKENPTFENAHFLKSALGQMMNKIAKNPTNAITYSEITKIGNAKTLLESHMDKFLQSVNPKYSTEYKKASDYFAKNVAPYLEKKQIREIVEKGKTDIDNLHSVFKNPTDYVDKKTGLPKTGSINKILQDLTQESKDRILYSRLSGHENSENPNKLLSDIKKAENKGYSKYISQEFKKDANKLTPLMKQRKRMEEKIKSRQKLLGYGAGAAGVGALGGAIGTGMYHHLGE